PRGRDRLAEGGQDVAAVDEGPGAGVPGDAVDLAVDGGAVDQALDVAGADVLPISATSGTWPPPMAVTNWSWALAQGTNWIWTRSPGWAASKSPVAPVRKVRRSGDPGSMIHTRSGPVADVPRPDGVSRPQPGTRATTSARSRARRIRR